MSNELHLPGYNLDDDAPDEFAIPSTEPENTVLIPSSAAATPLPTQSTPAQQRSSAAPTSPEQPATGEFADPKIAPLHAIFPEFDAAILYSVIDSVGGNQDRAVDALLAMSDPDHRPSESGAALEQPSVAAQTQLDEEFARQLLLEEEEEYARDRIARQQQQTRPFPYAQRSNIPATSQGQDHGAAPQQPSQRDTMTDVQEHISKIAETGKRTFSSFVSKVKAKVQEFDQSRNTQNPSPPGAGAAGTQPPTSGLDRHAQQAYYAPRADPKPRPGAGAFDRTGNSPSPGATVPATTSPKFPPFTKTNDKNSDWTPLPPPPSATSASRPVANIDPGKIGLLPKRPVSLVNTESPVPSRHAPDDSDEELEYVENPFEEGKYS